jgi:8-oxo-dGTP diphosphatase
MATPFPFLIGLFQKFFQGQDGHPIDNLVASNGSAFVTTGEMASIGEGGIGKEEPMRVRVSAVFERDQEILCMKYVYGGKEVFALPGGGVDKDIPLQNTIIDEWRNEIGVKLTVGDIIMIGEAPATKRHPQTLHIVFAAHEIHGVPKIRPDSTHSLDIAWVPIVKLYEAPLYPDVGKQLHDYLTGEKQRSLEFIGNCMERGFW